jgi:hypothetical protein
MKIESGIPIPKNRQSGAMLEIRTALNSMAHGDSFVWDSQTMYRHVYLAAKQVGAKVVARKLPKGGWRVWKL